MVVHNGFRILSHQFGNSAKECFLLVPAKVWTLDLRFCLTMSSLLPSHEADGEDVSLESAWIKSKREALLQRTSGRWSKEEAQDLGHKQINSK